MQRYQITHINNDRRDNKHANIKHFAGLCPDGITKWNASLTEIISWMKAHPQAVFFTSNMGELAIVEIIPATLYCGEYLRTRFYDVLSDHLLALPEFTPATEGNIDNCLQNVA